ncbi:MAG: NAD(P)H-dependent glycerol-3-phosphate dehydrogenase [Legionellaceae bacterium]|nr:NAD(P)H-dependent glycerol-3-phosphate dehydrogenase [Legionellaceae bacterium]
MIASSVAVLGAGSWGTAVARHIANSGKHVFLWARDKQHVQDMVAERCNQRYLPQVPFPPQLEPIADLAHCVSQATEIIIAVPSHAFASLLTKLPKPAHGLSWITKGIDPSTHKLLSELVAEQWGSDYPMTVISGPSFAKEVARGLPTALVIAGNNAPYQQSIRTLLHDKNMRVYLSNDLTGVQLCGAVKNILAIACGISDGLHYGANAKAALITRGLAEMSRLGLCLGARPDTFMGLAGVGDLVLTCTDDQSRNRRFGLQLGQGVDPISAEKNIGQVVEGKHNAAQICALAMQHNVEMPICEEVNALLQGKHTLKKAVANLLNRPPREEF